MRKPFFAALWLVLVGVAGLSPSRADDGTWTNTVSGNWSVAANWLNGIVADGAGSLAKIEAGISANTTVTLNGDRTVGKLSFSDTAGSQNNEWTLTDAGVTANTLTLNNGASAPVIEGKTIYNNINVILEGANGVTVESDPNKEVRFQRTNTYSGVTTVRRGSLILMAPSATGALGTDTSAIQLGDASTPTTENIKLAMYYGAQTNSRNIVVNNYGSNVVIGTSGTADQTLTRFFTGAITLNRHVILGGELRYSAFTGRITGTGGIKVGGFASANAVSLYGPTNSFTGDTVVSAGYLYLYTNVASGADSPIGNSTNTVVIGDDDTGTINTYLYLHGPYQFDRPVRVTNKGTGTPTIGNSGTGVATFTAPIQIEKSMQIYANSAAANQVKLANTVSGSGGIETEGTGSMLLTGTNTFTGDVIMNRGELRLETNVLAGEDGPLGNSTNAILIRKAGDFRRLYAYKPALVTRPILVDSNAASVAIGVGVGAGSGAEFRGPITIRTNVVFYAADPAQVLISGLVSGPGKVLVQGVSSGNYVIFSNPSNTFTGPIEVNVAGAAARLVAAATGCLGASTTNIVIAASSGVNLTSFLLTGPTTIDRNILVPTTAWNGKLSVGSTSAHESVLSGNLAMYRTNSLNANNYGIYFTAVSGGVCRLTGRIDGANRIRKEGTGMVALEGVNSVTNDVEIQAGDLWAVDGAGLNTNSLLTLDGGVLAGTGLFRRVLGPGQGQIRWIAGSAGGFAARGGKLTVDLNNPGVDTLQFSLTPYFVTNAEFVLGSYLATHEMEFVDNVDCGAASRTFRVRDNPNTLGDVAHLSGVLTNGSAIEKYGSGVLMLSASNTVTTDFRVREGTLLVSQYMGGAKLTVYSNAFLGGSGVVDPTTFQLTAGAGFSWADRPGTLTIKKTFTLPSGTPIDFAYNATAHSRVDFTGTLTLPAAATIRCVPLGAARLGPDTLVLFSAPALAGATDLSGWTLENNTSGFTVNRVGTQVILTRPRKGTIISIY